MVNCSWHTTVNKLWKKVSYELEIWTTFSCVYYFQLNNSLFLKLPHGALQLQSSPFSWIFTMQNKHLLLIKGLCFMPQFSDFKVVAVYFLKRQLTARQATPCGTMLFYLLRLTLYWILTIVEVLSFPWWVEFLTRWQTFPVSWPNIGKLLQTFGHEPVVAEQQNMLANFLFGNWQML